MKQTVYTNEPPRNTTLAMHEVVFVLNNHNIQYKVEDNIVMMFDEYVIDEWIPAPMVYGPLLTQIGY